MRVRRRRPARGPRWLLTGGVLTVAVIALLGAPNAGPGGNAGPEAARIHAELERWWGGPAYYAKFPRAVASGWTRPDFFPIAVFFGPPQQAPRLAALGINTYMGAEHEPPISTITRTGISVIASTDWTPAEVGDDNRVVGWHISDECEMGSYWCASKDEHVRVEKQRSFADQARALHDGRFLQANFGSGVLGTWWAPTTMDDHLALVDVSSVDEYARTSPGVRDLIRDSPAWPPGADPASASAYGWLQDRMETFNTPAASKPNWVFVEVARPYLTDDGARTITAAEIGGSVWSALIHGAAGIAYFQHNNDPSCGNYALVDCGATRADAVKTIDAEVRALAPVLNSQPYRWQFGPGLQTSLRSWEGHAYVLAMTSGGTGERTFRLPPGVNGAAVEVVGEHRTIRVSHGRFSDTFATADTHHVYRVALA
ncbi:hypothetical protein [Xylanimonas sp. McL0601]|uniref:hypothetical protein n=1 Tax=Xylanimonas sp. McL0601 TaxID=3414739 RepID=UPI003CFA6B55